MSKFIILDCHCLCHRAFHSTGELKTKKGKPTGVIFGFLRDLFKWREQFRDHIFIFCWDLGIPKRIEIYPNYKRKRIEKKQTMSDEEKKAYGDLQKQIEELRTDTLSSLGYLNIFAEDGFEADDLIAAICIEQAEKEDTKQITIVGNDKDLYQLCTIKKIRIYNPRKKEFVSASTIIQTEGIHPRKWATVKAIAGCDTDDVKGVKGVGEKTAIKYLKKELSTDSKIYKRIISHKEMIRGNRKIVELPLAGTPVQFEICDDRERVTGSNWKRIAKKYEILTLLKG